MYKLAFLAVIPSCIFNYHWNIYLHLVPHQRKHPEKLLILTSDLQQTLGENQKHSAKVIGRHLKDWEKPLWWFWNTLRLELYAFKVRIGIRL